MGLEVIDGKKSKWEGLWWHPESQYFSSAAISLEELKKFKGSVRLFVRKNKFFNNGENGRPNYVFSLCDAKAESPRELQLKDIEDFDESFDDTYYDNNGNRLYTYEEVQDVINKCACYIGGDGEYGEHLVEDFI